MKPFLDTLRKFDVPNVLFLTLTPIIGFGGTWFLASRGDIPVPTLVLTVIMAILTGIAITAGYHRLFSHKSFDAHPIFKFVMLVFGAAAFENSALRWSSDHRRHHKFVDTEQDPYNIKQGFFHAHMGWVMKKYDNTHVYNNVVDLESDPLLIWQQKHYVKLGILFGLVLPTGVAALWGDALGGFFVAGFLRTVLNHHFTFSINSFAHLFGGQPYSDANSARDSWILALVTYGEGYHNYHHKFPSDYRNGIRGYHWDPTKWLVYAVEKIGLTANLRRMPIERILLARLKMDEKRLMKRIDHAPTPHLNREFVIAARERIEDAYVHFRKLKTEYQRLKAQKLDALHTQVAHWNERIATMKRDLQNSRERLRKADTDWTTLCESAGVQSAGFIYG